MMYDLSLSGNIIFKIKLYDIYYAQNDVHVSMLVILSRKIYSPIIFTKNINYSRKHRYESSRGPLFRASYLGTLFRRSRWAPLLRPGGCTIVGIGGYQIEASAHRAVCTLDHDLHGKIHHGQTTAFPAVRGLLLTAIEISPSRASTLLAIRLAIRQTRRTISTHIVV